MTATDLLGRECIGTSRLAIFFCAVLSLAASVAYPLNNICRSKHDLARNRNWMLDGCGHWTCPFRCSDAFRSSLVGRAFRGRIAPNSNYAFVASASGSIIQYVASSVAYELNDDLISNDLGWAAGTSTNGLNPVSRIRRYTGDPLVLGVPLWKHTHWASATASMRSSKSWLRSL